MEYERSMTELVGLAKGILCDNIVVESEGVALRQWLVSNPEVMDVNPGMQIADRLLEMFSDGQLCDADRAELKIMLSAFVQALESRHRHTQRALARDELQS